MLFLINPRGEFPLNDDWSYARAVKIWHDAGRLAFPVPWASMTLIAHLLWGWLVTSLFGFSHFVLRMGNLVPAIAGIAGVYFLLREARVSRSAAFLATATTAFSPWYMQLSLSFMTDVPFLAATIWSSVFLLRALSGKAKRDFRIGLGLSLVATMIRQHGIFIAIAWAVAYLWQNRTATEKNLLLAWLPLIVNSVYLGIHQLVLGPVLGTHSTVLELHNWVSIILEQGWGAALGEMCFRAAAILIYAGVLSAPVWIYSLWSEKLRLSWGLLAAAVVAILVPVLWRPFIPRPFDIVYNLGIGPPTLRDVYLLGLPNLPTAPQGVWIAFTAVGIFGGVLLIARWLKAVGKMLSERKSDSALVLLTVFSLGCLALVPFMPFLDRHMLLLLPLLYLLAAPRETEEAVQPRAGLVAALIIVLGTATFTTAGLHNYFAWNRARWTAAEWLTAVHGAVPEEIDGGFEYNGWNTFDPNFHPTAEQSWWWVKFEEYLVTFGPVPGYGEYTSFSYSTWLPPGQRAIHVLHRNNFPPALQPAGQM